MKKKLPKPGEIYAYYIEELQKYGACQIIKAESKSVCYVSLDFLTDYLPAKEEIFDWKPLYLESFRNHHRMDAGWIDLTPVPPSYQYLGEFPLVTEKSSNSFCGRWPDGSAYIFEMRWRAFGEEVTAAYKKYMNSGEDVVIHGKTFLKRQPVLTDDIYGYLKEQDSLGYFPCMNVARIEGFSEKLPNLIKTAPLLTRLELKNPGVSVMDLRGTGLDNLELDMTGVKRLYLPEKVRRLFFYGNIEKGLIVEDGTCDGNLPSVFLRVSLRKAQISRFGMERIRVKDLVINDIAEIDAAEIVKCFPDLIELHMTGCPGIVKNAQMLGELKNLQVLSLSDLFGYGMELLEGIGQIPALWNLRCESIPKEAGTEIKKQCKGKITVLSVKKLRDADWLKENMDNPLRHWDGSEFIPPAAYRKAFQCYKNTKKQLKEAGNREDVLSVVQAYTEQFNQLNDKYGELIETEERDDIFNAMKQLYEGCVSEKSFRITLEEIYDAMDEVRGDW